MSGELHGKALFTIFVVWLMLWPSLRLALHPERLTSRFEPGAPEIIKRGAALICWLQVILSAASLVYVWVWI
jgi:hypothetical protein